MLFRKTNDDKTALSGHEHVRFGQHLPAVGVNTRVASPMWKLTYCRGGILMWIVFAVIPRDHIVLYLAQTLFNLNGNIFVKNLFLYLDDHLMVMYLSKVDMLSAESCLAYTKV